MCRINDVPTTFTEGRHWKKQQSIKMECLFRKRAKASTNLIGSLETQKSNNLDQLNWETLTLLQNLIKVLMKY